VAIRYLLNSEAITSPSLYRYELVSVEEARTWLPLAGGSRAWVGVLEKHH